MILVEHTKKPQVVGMVAVLVITTIVMMNVQVVAVVPQTLD